MLNNKLNNKGFAVSVILYSIAAVIIIVLLLIVSVNSANVHNTLNMSEKIKEDVSDKLPGNQDGPNSVTCSIGQTWEYDYTGGAQIFITPCTGVYKIEAYGAQGQGINSQGSTRGGGKGTYVFGNIEIEENTNINMYVGGAGTVDAAGYNGGGAGISGSGGGGGATDIRINGTALSNRVLVAGGGGGGPYFSNRYNPYDIETMEYGNAVGTLNSTLGKGTDGIKVTYDSEYFASGGGGGGYYGGYSNALLTYNSTNSQFTWQGGGSSYINTDYFFNYENNTLSDITYTGTNGQSDLRSNNVVYYKNSGDGKVIITYVGPTLGIPTAPTIIGGSTSWSTSAKTISVSVESASPVGIKNYQYCISTSTSSCDGTWTDLANGTKSISVSTPGTRYTYFRAVNKNGIIGKASSYQITKIDTGAPTAPTITGGSTNWSTSAKTISVSTESSAASGINNYQYCISTSTDSCNGTWTDLASGTKSKSISTNGTRYIYFRAISGAGKIGTISEYQITKIDTSNPTVTASVTEANATFTIKDNIGVVAYGVNQSSTEEPTYTEITSTTEATETYTATAGGTYYVWVKDASGRTANEPFIIDSSLFCSLASGDAVTFSSNKATAPCSGYYKVVAKSGWGGYYAYEYDSDQGECKPGNNLLVLSNAGESNKVKFAGEQSKVEKTIYIEKDSALVRTIGAGGTRGFCALDESGTGGITNKPGTAGGKSYLKVDGVTVVTSGTGKAATSSTGNGPCNSSGCNKMAVSVWGGKNQNGVWNTGNKGSVTVTYQGTTQ